MVSVLFQDTCDRIAKGLAYFANPDPQQAAFLIWWAVSRYDRLLADPQARAQYEALLGLNERARHRERQRLTNLSQKGGRV